MYLPYSAIKDSFSSTKVDDQWSFKEAKRSDTSYISHGYHRYPAKFIPQIVHKLILEYTNENDFVLDPFGGCGTTLVEAKVLGRKSVGFDINPVAKLITETKTTPLEPESLGKNFSIFEKKYKKIKRESINLEHSQRINYWFDPIIQGELDKLFNTINTISDHKIKRFYLCAFSQILKNCSKWLMKSTKPQIDPNKIPPDVYSTFISHLKKMMTKNEEFYSLLKQSNNLSTFSKMKLCDSTKKFPLETNSVDLIITSPPYVTSYEYADLHQLILLWLGDDAKRFHRWNKYAEEYQSFREKFVGTKLAKDKQTQKFLGFFAHQIINQLPNKKEYLKSVPKYFLDMQKSISEMYRILKPGKRVCIIIGNTTLAGVEVKNAEVAVEQMQDAGFIIEKIIKRELSNKMITPWRDGKNGKFTSITNSDKRRVYEHEFILIARKPLILSN